MSVPIKKQRAHINIHQFNLIKGYLDESYVDYAFITWLLRVQPLDDLNQTFYISDLYFLAKW